MSYRPLAHAGFPNAGALEAAPRGRDLLKLAHCRTDSSPGARIRLPNGSRPRADTHVQVCARHNRPVEVEICEGLVHGASNRLAAEVVVRLRASGQLGEDGSAPLIRALSWSLWISHIRTPPGDNRRMWAGTLLSRRLEVGPDTDTTQLLRALWKEDDDRGSPDSDLTAEIRNRFAYNMKGIGW